MKLSTADVPSWRTSCNAGQRPASQAGRIRKPEADAAGPCAQDLFLQMCQASEHDTPLLRLLRLQQAAAPAAGGAAVRPAPPRGAPGRQPCAGQ